MFEIVVPCGVDEFRHRSRRERLEVERRLGAPISSKRSRTATKSDSCLEVVVAAPCSRRPARRSRRPARPRVPSPRRPPSRRRGSWALAPHPASHSLPVLPHGAIRRPGPRGRTGFGTASPIGLRYIPALKIKRVDGTDPGGASVKRDPDRGATAPPAAGRASFRFGIVTLTEVPVPARLAGRRRRLGRLHGRSVRAEVVREGPPQIGAGRHRGALRAPIEWPPPSLVQEACPSVLACSLPTLPRGDLASGSGPSTLVRPSSSER